MSGKSYYYWIDTAKVIGIFLVIYGHGGLAGYPINEIIYTFHMPLFFLLSGMLYHPISPGQTLRKDWHTLLLPYLLLNLVCLIPFLLSPLKGTFTWERLFQRVGAIILGLGYEHDYWVPVSTPCWFLISLFLGRLILSLAYKHFKPKALFVISLFSIIATWLLHRMDVDTLVPIDSTLMAMPFLCVGYVLKPLFLKDDITEHKKLFCLISLITMLLTCIVWLFNGRVDVNKCLYGNLLLLYYVGGLLGSICVILFSKCISIKGGVFHIVSSGTLLIIGLNLWMISIVKVLFRLVFPDRECSGIAGFMLAVICLLIFYPLILVVKRIFPVILGKRN